MLKRRASEEVGFLFFLFIVLFFGCNILKLSWGLRNFPCLDKAAFFVEAKVNVSRWN